MEFHTFHTLDCKCKCKGMEFHTLDCKYKCKGISHIRL